MNICKHRKSLSQETKICLFLLLVGTVLKLCYAVQVPYNISKHDLGTVSDWAEYGKGHLSYIQYLYQNHHLLAEDPRAWGQFYHPPLFHIIGAFVFQIFYTEGGGTAAVFEWIQIVNTLFACGISVVCYRILNHLRVTGRKQIFLTAFFSFCPSLYWIGTILNNDCLMTLLLAVTIEQTILWIKQPCMSRIVKMALALALAMLTKTSAVLIAPAIGCVFLYELIRRIRQKANRKELWKQFIAFALISIPLGTCYVMRNWIRFGVEPSYVLDPGKQSTQYIGNCTLVQRLGVPSLRQLFSVRIHWDIPEEFSNIWGQTILTMSLDEGILALPNIYAKCLAGIMVWLGAGIVILLLIRSLQSFLDGSVELPIKLLTGIGTIGIFGSYLLFAFQYPQICTMNFRYIFSILIFGAAGYGICSKKMSIIEQILIGGYCLISTGLYFFCAI